MSIVVNGQFTSLYVYLRQKIYVYLRQLIYID